MAYKGIHEDFLKISRGEMPSRVPFFCISQEFDAAYYGVTYEEYLSSADTMVKAQVKALEEFNYDWVLYQLHDCLEFEALGLKITGSGNILPGIGSHLPISQETKTSLKIPNFEVDPKIKIFLNALKQTKKIVGDTALVVGRIASPFSSAVMLYGIENTMMALIDSETVIIKTLDFFYDLQKKFALIQQEYGADTIWYGDCLASSKLISLDMYKKFAFESNKRLVSELKKKGLKIIYEPADDKVDYMETYSQTGIHAINVGIALDMSIAKEKLQGKMGLLGNLDSIKYLQNSSPEEVYKETERILKLGKPNGGYAFCTDSIPLEVAYENMKAMAKAVRDNCEY
ncbi:MAG: uroporphyrinogen decarboxylase family protein [bacterium]